MLQQHSQLVFGRLEFETSEASNSDSGQDASASYFGNDGVPSSRRFECGSWRLVHSYRLLLSWRWFSSDVTIRLLHDGWDELSRIRSSPSTEVHSLVWPSYQNFSTIDL